MKEITIDSNIWTLLKKNIGKNLDGNGFQKDSELSDPLEALGKKIIESKLTVEEYKQFVEECYSKLKYIKKFKDDYLKSVSSLAIYFYHLDPSLVSRDNKEIEERKNLRDKLGIKHHDQDVSDLSHKYNNYTTYEIKEDNGEIVFNKNNFKDNILNMGNLQILNFTSKDISHINIKNLPYKIKSDLDIHPSIYKKIIKEEYIDAQIHELIEFHSDLQELYWAPDFNQIRDWIYDKKQKEFLNFVSEGKKLQYILF